MKINQNNILVLKNKNFVAKVNATLGGNLIFLRSNSGAIILREPDYEKGIDNPYLYGMPILFPVNRIENGKFNFDGREYLFDINEPNTNCHLHGELHNKEFSVLYETEKRVVLSIKSTLGKVNDFELVLDYCLVRNGIKLKTTVYNLSKLKMPVMLGFHTTFNSNFLIGGKNFIKVSFNREIERNMANYLPNGNYPEFDSVSNELLSGKFNPLSQPISRHYSLKNCGKIVNFDENSNVSVVYKNSKNLNYRLIYNGDASGYICLEPQTSMANAPNVSLDKNVSGFDYIKPLSKKVYKSKILLLKGDKR